MDKTNIGCIEWRCKILSWSIRSSRYTIWSLDQMACDGGIWTWPGADPVGLPQHPLQKYKNHLRPRFVHMGQRGSEGVISAYPEIPPKPEAFVLFTRIIWDKPHLSLLTLREPRDYSVSLNHDPHLAFSFLPIEREEALPPQPPSCNTANARVCSEPCLSLSRPLSPSPQHLSPSRQCLLPCPIPMLSHSLALHSLPTKWNFSRESFED
jgi:hypothetical protein